MAISIYTDNHYRISMGLIQAYKTPSKELEDLKTFYETASTCYLALWMSVTWKLRAFQASISENEYSPHSPRAFARILRKSGIVFNKLS